MQKINTQNTKERIISLAQADRAREACVLCRKLCHSTHADADSWFMLGVLEGQLGRTDDAIHAYRRAVTLDPEHLTAHYNLGYTLLISEHRSEAMDSFREAVRIKPDFPEALTNLGALLKESGELEQAVEFHERAIKTNPNFSLAHYNLGNALFEKADFESAIRCYQNAIRLDPNYADAHYNLARSLHTTGREESAVSHLHNAISINSNFSDAQRMLVRLLLTQGKQRLAAEHCSRMIRLSPDRAIGHILLANLLVEQEDHKRAAVSYSTALKIDPGNIEAANNLGNVLFSLGRFSDAAATYRRILENRPDYAEGFHNLGNAVRELGRPEEAIECYRRALELRPELLQSRYMLATLSEDEAPSSPPPKYVAQLFDQYAWKFYKHLRDELDYHTPEQILDAVSAVIGGTPSERLHVLDLGCGTGLCGPLFRPFARTMVGVDLSSKMLEKARARQVYDRLIAGDLLVPLQEPDAAYHLILAADVFVYLGNLTDVFLACRNTLEPNGLFVFSTEAETSGTGYRLRRSGRYAHSIPYIRGVSSTTGFSELFFRETVLRKEKGIPIPGYIFVLGKSEALD